MKKALLLSGITLLALAGMLLCSIGKQGVFAGDIEQTGRICGDITFGTTPDSSSQEVTTITPSLYSTLNLDIASATGSKIFLANKGNAAKFGSGSGDGSLTFTFSSAYRISKVKALAWQYSSSDVASITVTTSAYTSSTAQKVTTSSAPDISDSSTDGGYVFTGLDGGTGSASTSLSIASSKRFYLAKLVLTITGASEVSSSSSSMASSSSSGVTSTSSSTPSSSSLPAYQMNASWPDSAKTYRVAPGDYSSQSSAPVYEVSASGGAYTGTQVTTIRKTQDCLTYEEVGLYFAAFRQAPPNYKTTSALAVSYGTNGRVLSQYHKYGSGAYSGSTDYSTKFGSFNDTDYGSYWEFDIDATGAYNNGNSITRGAARVVIVLAGLSDYGSEPVSFFTLDHYADFVECYNFSGGWSPLFAGVENGSGSYHNVPITSATRLTPATVSYAVS